jgi:hypothetical protein
VKFYYCGRAIEKSDRSGSDRAKAGLPEERVVLIGYLRALECAFRPRNGNFSADSARFKGMRNGSKKIVYEVSGNYAEAPEKKAGKILEYFDNNFNWFPK